MVHFAEIIPASPPCSILQHIGRVAIPKPVPRNFLRYLQTTIIMVIIGDRTLVSEFM